jgi:hypothetical protein
MDNIPFTKIDLIKLFRLVYDSTLMDSKIAVELFLSANLIAQDGASSWLFSKQNVVNYIKFLGLFTSKKLEFIDDKVYPAVSKPVDVQTLRLLLDISIIR